MAKTWFWKNRFIDNKCLEFEDSWREFGIQWSRNPLYYLEEYWITLISILWYFGSLGSATLWNKPWLSMHFRSFGEIFLLVKIYWNLWLLKIYSQSGQYRSRLADRMNSLSWARAAVFIGSTLHSLLLIGRAKMSFRRCKNLPKICIQ